MVGLLLNPLPVDTHLANLRPALLEEPTQPCRELFLRRGHMVDTVCRDNIVRVEFEPLTMV
jgi:hypothetical protein